MAVWMALGTAEAKPALEAHNLGGVSISMPRGWTFTGDEAKGMALAQQDPKRKDAAQLIVIASSSTATEDQLLDGVTSQIAQDLKVVKRGPGPSAGKLLVADGVSSGVTVRLGAAAIVANGTAVVGLLVSKPSEFDQLGGTDLVLAVMTSMKATATAAPTQGVMQPQYEGDRLVVPALTRTLDVSELAGEWSRNDSAGRSVAGSMSGVAIGEVWTIEANGKLRDEFRGAVVGNGNGRNIHDVSYGTVSIRDGMLVIGLKKPQYYILRGWFFGRDMTVMEIDGPYYDPVAPKDIANPNYNIYMRERFVRTTK